MSEVKPVGVFGCRLAQAIRARGATVPETARDIGVGKQSIYNWIGGERYPNGYTLIRLCRALGVSSDWLLGLEDEDE